jgi:hypothetical protein
MNCRLAPNMKRTALATGQQLVRTRQIALLFLLSPAAAQFLVLLFDIIGGMLISPLCRLWHAQHPLTASSSRGMDAPRYKQGVRLQHIYQEGEGDTCIWHARYGVQQQQHQHPKQQQQQQQQQQQ